MRIEFDPKKRASNIVKHDGLDFADLDPAFFEAADITAAKMKRFAAVGYFQGELLTVVFSRLGSEGVSVISMRPASRQERKRYEKIDR